MNRLVSYRTSLAPIPLVVGVLVAVLAVACGSDDPATTSTDGSASTSPSTTEGPAESTTTESPTAAGAGVDLTHLPVGDGMTSTSAERDHLWSCQTNFGGGGASSQGPWFNGDGTWDATKKIAVSGEVDWPSEFSVAVEGEQRVFTGNDLPDHATGLFPVATDDEAYQYDRNPNSIAEQAISFAIPAEPEVADAPSCVGGEVGVLLSGAMLFNAVDAGGRDAVAWEVQDACDGHPQMSGVYHYHSVSDCTPGIAEVDASGHSVLIGYAFDGFGIFGHNGEGGAEVTNEDLDECHGHVGEVEWEGEMVEMYHYHATYEYPYTVGCFRGTAASVHTG